MFAIIVIIESILVAFVRAGGAGVVGGVGGGGMPPGLYLSISLCMSLVPSSNVTHFYPLVSRKRKDAND